MNTRSLRILSRAWPAAALFLLLADVALANPRARSGSVDYTSRRGGTVDAQGQSVGRYRSGSVEAESANGATYDASGTRVGRFATGSKSATGPNGASYDASGTRVGRYTTGSVNAKSVNGASYSASSSSWSGYRAGYVYSGGTYHSANVVVNKAYVAPVGAYAGWTVVAQPTYVVYPQFATYPVEVAVQAQLKQLGYYGGTIDGQIGPKTQSAIAKYQAAQGLPVNGRINQALLKSLGIA